MSLQPQTDTSDMIAVHDALRRVLRTAPDVIARVPAGDDDRVAVVASYFANALAFLHVHHEGEDELLWPKLMERVDDRELVARIAAQHGDVTGALAEAEATLATWAGSPTVANGEALSASLAELDAVLSPHLADEEAMILPLAAVHISPPEWGGLAAHGMANFSGDKMWLILGLIREAMTDEQRASMLEHMPPPAVEFWTGVGEPQFTSFIATVRA